MDHVKHMKYNSLLKEDIAEWLEFIDSEPDDGNMYWYNYIAFIFFVLFGNSHLQSIA